MSAPESAEGLPAGYRPGVGVMVLNRAGKVFVAQRIDTAEEAWQMPQGGIDPGETAEAAALRELEEETSIRNVALLGKSRDWIPYDLPPHLVGRLWDGNYRGQAQRWFAFRFLGGDQDIDLETATPEFKAWKWVDIAELPELIVPFKRRLYERLVAEFRHLARPGTDDKGR